MIQGSGWTGSGAVVGHDLQVWFESYLRVCNRHTFAELGTFVAPRLVINERPESRDGYAAELRRIARGFPDFRRTLQQLVLNDDWLAARFRTSGTHLGTFHGLRSSGTVVSVDEIALYRVVDFVITEIRSTLTEIDLLERIRSAR